MALAKRAASHPPRPRPYEPFTESLVPAVDFNAVRVGSPPVAGNPPFDPAGNLPFDPPALQEFWGRTGAAHELYAVYRREGDRAEAAFAMRRVQMEQPGFDAMARLIMAEAQVEAVAQF